jgi:hypothetical protein
VSLTQSPKGDVAFAQSPAQQQMRCIGRLQNPDPDSIAKIPQAHRNQGHGECRTGNGSGPGDAEPEHQRYQQGGPALLVHQYSPAATRCSAQQQSQGPKSRKRVTAASAHPSKRFGDCRSAAFNQVLQQAQDSIGMIAKLNARSLAKLPSMAFLGQVNPMIRHKKTTT